MDNIYLRELSLDDGEKELEFVRNFPETENGFQNVCKGESLQNLENFKKRIKEKIDQSNGIGLPEGRVPETVYWIMKGDTIVGIGKLRHYLNDILLKHGGNIGYGIAEDYRGMGIGSKALSLLIEESKKYDQEEILITVDDDNIASCKVVEKNGGILRDTENGCCYYWVRIKDKQPKTV